MMSNEYFTYERTWEEIEHMLDIAEKKMNYHAVNMQKRNKKRGYHLKNFKAMQGVVKSLRWVLGDKDIEHPLE